MKLRLDEYYYIISDEFDEIEDYMPQYMVEELDKFREGEKTIYIDFYPGVGYYENIWNK